MYFASRTLFTSTLSRGVATRLFSSECAPAEKLRGIFSEYRREHFSREIPSRFKKDLLKPYIGSNGSLEVDELDRLLVNIGHAQDRLSEDEKSLLLQEAGSSDRSIKASKMMELMD